MFSRCRRELNIALMDRVVMGATQGGEVGESCFSRVRPVLNVMGMGVLGWSSTPWIDATSVSSREYASQTRRNDALFTSVINDFAWCAH